MEAGWEKLSDGLGPSKVVLIHEPDFELRAVLVVDNVACGPSIGGIRMAKDVGVEEVARLARAMTFKNAAAGLPHGGGKAGILADPTMEPLRKERLVRAFGRAIADIADYIPGPDMGTDERCMAWLSDEMGRVVGLPRAVGGIPLDEIGATGFGVAVAAEAVQEAVGMPIEGARVAIQGFGAVGRHAAVQLVRRGARLVAVADSRGAVHRGDGLDVEALLAHKAGGATVHSFPGGQPMSNDDLLGVPCEIFVPAARPDVLHAGNVEQLSARLVLPGANIPATPAAEERLHEKGILMIPDFVANAGGVICAAVEYHGGTESQAFAVIEEKIGRNTREVIQRSRDGGISPREAAEGMAAERVREAMGYRRRGMPAPPGLAR